MLVVTIEFGTTYGDILCGCDAAVVCVPTCCHRRSFVCASCAGVSPDMCANNLDVCFSVRPCVDSSSASVRKWLTMMLTQNRTHALPYNITISSEEKVGVVRFCCTSLRFGVCTCLLAEYDQVITRILPECHILFWFRSFELNISIPQIQPCWRTEPPN